MSSSSKDLSNSTSRAWGTSGSTRTTFDVRFLKRYQNQRLRPGKDTKVRDEGNRLMVINPLDSSYLQVDKWQGCGWMARLWVKTDQSIKKFARLLWP